MARWVVRPGHTVIVDAMNPRIMADVTNEPRLRDVADDVAVKLQTPSIPWAGKTQLRQNE